MFLNRLSCFSSSLLPHSHPVLSWAGFKNSTTSTNSPNFISASRSWWPVRGFPPNIPRPLYSNPPFQQVCTTRVSHARNTNRGIFSSRSQSFATSTSFMTERLDGDRGPPYKRRKSTEERKTIEHTAVTEGAKEGRRDHQHQDPSTGGHFIGGGRDSWKDGAGKGVNRENSRNVERHKYWNKSRLKKESTSRDEIPNRRRSGHQQGEYKDSQTGGPRTQTPKSKQGQDVGYVQNSVWFKERTPGKEWEHHRNTRGPDEKVKDGSSNGEIRSQTCSMAHASNPPRMTTTSKQSPTGPSPPDRLQDRHTHVRPLQRHWETSPVCSTHPQPPGVSTAFDFSVMSYNILSQELLQDNAYLYRHCDRSVLPWDYRLPNLLAEFQHHNADILCLQEVQENHYETHIKPALQKIGYNCEYKKRTGGKPDGCAVIYKSSRFSLLSSNPVEFFRPGDSVLDRDNVGLVVLLRPNDTTGWSGPSTFICVANTHLLYNPRRGDVKLAQLAVLLAEISRLSRLPDGSTAPVVLCGDFNSTPWSPLYSFLTTGSLEYGGLPMRMVSGQEDSPRGHRTLQSPILSQSLGINHQCQYETAPPSSPGAVEGAISNLTVEDVATKAAAAAFNRLKLEHNLKLQSSYQHRLMLDGRPEVTTCHSQTAMTVDYILFTPEPVTRSSLPGVWGLQLLGRLSLVGQSELQDINGLPNQHHSSDHLPLLACFRLQH